LIDCTGPLHGLELRKKNCSYNEYFEQVDKDGLGPTDAIIRELITRYYCVVLQFSPLVSQ